MGDAIGLTSIGSHGLSAGSDSIIYDAIVNGIGEVITCASYNNANSRSISIKNYNLMYYNSTSTWFGSNNVTPPATVNGWVYDFNMLSQLYSTIVIGYFEINFNSDFTITVEPINAGNGYGVITTLFLKV